MSQTYNLGKVAITPRGAYSSAAQYTPLDILSYNGSSYLVLQNCMGVTPPNATYYMVVASKGDTGSAGASPTIAAGTVTMTPAGTSASVTNVGTNVNASFNFTLPSGNMIYTGTGVTGTSTDPTVFSGSGVVNAGVGDIYFNTSIVAFYQCILGGAASTAKWVFLTYAVPDGSISTSKVADSAITTNKIADGAVGEDELSSGAVRLSKLASDVTEVLDYKANVDGAYEQMTVGNAEQIVSTVGITDESPYLFRTSGGSVDIGDRENDKILGGTVTWNQNLQEMTSTYWQASATGTTVAFADGVATVNASLQYAGINNKTNNRPTFPTGHKMLYSIGVKLTTAVANAVRVKINNQDQRYAEASTAWQTIQGIFAWNAANPVTFNVFDARSADRDAYQVKEPMLIDLTAMFGSTIADYVYTLETSTSGSGVAWLQNHGFFTRPYYSSNTGTLMSVNTSAHKTVGFNQWDEEWENGIYGDGNLATAKQENAAYIRCKNPIRVLPNTVYYFKVPNYYSNYARMRFYDAGGNKIGYIGTSSNRNATFTTPENCYWMVFWTGDLVGSGVTYNHDICINLHWDGERDGEYEPFEAHTYALDDVELRGIPKKDANNNLYYDGDEYAPDGTVTRKYAIRAYTSGDATDGSTMITDGTNTVYKLITPTTETADAFTNPQIVYDWGTEEYVDYGYYTGTRDVSIPVGHDTLYAANLRAKLEMMPDSPNNGNGDYVVRQTDGINSYVPLAIPRELPNAPAEEGTYYLEVTVDGEGNATYSWQSNA